MSSIKNPTKVGSHTKSGSVSSVPKAKPQKTTLAPKAPNAVPTHPGSGGF